MVLIDGANPAYLFPKSSGVEDALKRVETVISFGSFPGRLSAWADLILPDHDTLESEIALVPGGVESSSDGRRDTVHSAAV